MTPDIAMTYRGGSRAALLDFLHSGYMLPARPSPRCVSPASGGDRRLPLRRRERVITERALKARDPLSVSDPFSWRSAAPGSPAWARSGSYSNLERAVKLRPRPVRRRAGGLPPQLRLRHRAQFKPLESRAERAGCGPSPAAQRNARRPLPERARRKPSRTAWSSYSPNVQTPEAAFRH